MKVTNQNIAILEDDTHISHWVEQSGRLDHDRYALPIILQHIKPGDTVVDAGAFIGDHTIAYCNAVGESGHVHAFEPNKRAYECLEYNCKSAKTYNLGLSNFAETVYYSEDRNAGAGRILHDVTTSTQIKTTTLDSLQLSALDFLKIDVEGYEVAVLEGGALTIKKYRPKMWIEINVGALGQQGKTAADIENFLSELDYTYTAFPEIGEQYDLLCIPA
jgi:FkbM family methyltransferase